MNLPKLTKVTETQLSRPKILLLSDDITAPSGIGTQGKEFVLGTVDKFNWVQLAAAARHQAHNRFLDISGEVAKETGVEDASVKLYPYNGYGDPAKLRQILDTEKPDAILHFTDPRYWQWLYLMEHEIHTKYNIPIMYYAIWDDIPYPYWNYPAYSCSDLIMGISKQSHVIHKQVLEYGGTTVTDLDETTLPDDYKLSPNETLVAYVPHGINSKYFSPITDETHPQWEEFQKFQEDFRKDQNADFVIFWMNRNMRRKQPGDVIAAYAKFCDSLPKKEADRCCLIMHTEAISDAGTDLISVKRALCPNYKIVFSTAKLSTHVINLYYNLADVTLNIASNEGFGLSSAESIMAGTPVINNVTGGLQDQLRFEDENGDWFSPTVDMPSNHIGKYRDCGQWAYPVFPASRSVQGSPQTPYIMDDRCRIEDVADGMKYWFDMSRTKRKMCGQEGRAWMLSEANMSNVAMAKSMTKHIETLLDVWDSKPRFEMFQVEERKEITETGIAYI